jgi:hypothetical protein
VSVDDILSMVNIALGNAEMLACTAGDANGDGTITVDEILIAVNNALNGCSGRSATPSPTPPPTPTPTPTATSTLPPQDLVVDANTTVPGGAYRVIFVKNGGALTIGGDTVAQQVDIRWGTIVVQGNLVVSDSITIEDNPDNPGQLTVYGSTNSAPQLDILGGTLTGYGTWDVDELSIGGTGQFRVLPISGSYPGSGSLELRVKDLLVDDAAALSAVGAGADPRGLGVSSGGGGYGGAGGRGYWSATSPGGTYGDSFSYAIDSGSGSGPLFNYTAYYLGGGSLFVLASTSVVVNGTITADGSTGDGGGSGGGILIDTPILNISGIISAQGGAGEAEGGGGGGGRIKIFYRTLETSDTTTPQHFRVDGGPPSGDANTQPGGAGSVWRDAIPYPPTLVAPVDGAQLATRSPTFTFQVLDDSAVLDGRADDLSCILELSIDGFQNVFRTYDQNVSVAGWSDFSYLSGAQAQFTTPDSLDTGSYQWRARVRDRSVAGPNSDIRSFTIP